MPHATLKLQGGVIETETPVLNMAGIASCNRIRFRPDPQNLSLPEKLGGWGRFYASTVTNGPIRALWAYQDTNAVKWLAWGTDNAVAAQLATISCTTDPTSGLTTATGSVNNITPQVYTSSFRAELQTTGGSSQYTVIDNNIGSFLPNTFSVYVTTPINVGGVNLQGQFSTSRDIVFGSAYLLNGTDVLQNPLPAQFTTGAIGSFIGVSSVAYIPVGGSAPALLQFIFTTAVQLPLGSTFVITGASPSSINGAYIVWFSSPGVAQAETRLSSYTYAGGALMANNGVVPQFATTAGSSQVTVYFADNGYSVGDTYEVMNETLVGGIKIYGSYVVSSVDPQAALNGVPSYKFTINTNTVATQDAFQYQNAQTVTGGTGNGTTVTLNYNPSLYSHSFEFGQFINVAGVNPSAWNGHYVVTAVTTNSVSFANTTAGSWVSGGSVSDEGGDPAYVYAFSPQPGQVNVGTAIPAEFWSLDNWGNDLLAVPVPSDVIDYPDFSLPYQPIYYWDSTAGLPTASPIYNGPVACNGMFVAMPQRQIIAWGCNGEDPGDGIIDPLLVRWCDVNNFNTWIDQVTNQAGSFRLSSGAEIRGGRQVPQQGLLWTDIELWSMQYLSQPDIYGFNKIGQGCGLIAKQAKAHAVLGGIIYWMSETQFFALSGYGVQPIPCPIWDVIFQDLDIANANKIVAASNALFQEVAWYYPVKGGTGEVSAYIKLNVQLGVWDYGELARAAWIDQSVLGSPIGADPGAQLIYQHEISPDADGAAMGESFTTGWFSVADGDVMPYIDQIWPDFKYGYFGQTQGENLSMTFTAQAYPSLTLYSYGPYTLNSSTSYISPRMRSRLINFTVSGTGTGYWWRLGGCRYRFQPDGKY